MMPDKFQSSVPDQFDSMSGDLMDVCVCGDYRWQHKNGTGPCTFNDDYNNGGLTHGFKKCMSFRLSKSDSLIDK
jgi:hypothetical protein